VLSWKTGWIPTVVVVAVTAACGYKQEDAWSRMMLTLGMFEGVRITAVELLPIWWKNVAHRIEPPTGPVRELFGGNLTSLMIALYLIGHVLSWDWHIRSTVPFWYTPGKDHREIVHHLIETMAMYILHDTWHMIRGWKANQKPVMFLHHTVFAIVCVVGLSYPQLPEYVRVHGILFSAEASTPLLNLRWLLRNVGLLTRKSAVMTVVSVLFAVLFLLTRVLMYSLLIADLWKCHTSFVMPPFVQRLFVGVVAVSYCINLYWFSLIIKGMFVL
ncbi:unnamed protein product, partial [Choristocarpus tenellus]